MYYYSFAISCKWWMLFVVLTAVVMAVLGWRSASLKKIKKGKNKGKYSVVPTISSSTFLLVITIFTIIFAILFFTETIVVLVQVLYDMPMRNSSVWSVVLIVSVIAIAVIVYICLLSFFYTVFYDIKSVLLRKREKTMISRERKVIKKDPWL